MNQNIVLLVMVGGEIALVVLGLLVFMFIRRRRRAAKEAPVEEPETTEEPPQPASAAPPAESKEDLKTYATWLRDEKTKTLGILESIAGDADDSAANPLAEALKLRGEFLQIELDAWSLKEEEDSYQETLTQRMQALLEAYRPDAIETEVTSEAEAGAPSESDEQLTNIVDRSEEELNRLKEVISHQHDMMRELRESLSGQESDSDEWQAIEEKLQATQRHGEELTRCIEVLEQENERLKTASVSRRPGITAQAAARESESGEISELQSLIGGQQETIKNLHQLLGELVPEADKAQELGTMIAKIERANQELNGCLAVLENENESLRQRVTDFEAAADGSESQSGTADQPAADAAESADSGKVQEKVHDLEVQLEFRDLAIQELKDQYAELEATYNALKEDTDSAKAS